MPLVTDIPPALPLALFECHFQRSAAATMPAYAGSAWRGAFGHALKKTVCVARSVECPSCLLYRSCIYPYLFETPPPPDSVKMRRYNAVPHPFTLRLEAQADDLRFRLGFVLVGHAGRYAPYVVHAFAQAGNAGLGRDRQCFELIQVKQALDPAQDAWRLIYQPGQPLHARPARVPSMPAIPESFELHLESPLRLRRQGQLVTPTNFHFADLFGSLLRRISMLSYFHHDTPLEADFRALSQAARAISIEDSTLRWHDWTRYSSRQDSAMKMGGLLGHFRLRGAGMERFWPYVWLGQWTHAGKGATMGLGRYRIRAASLPDAA
jgi:hypothetical protein